MLLSSASWWEKNSFREFSNEDMTRAKANHSHLCLVQLNSKLSLNKSKVVTWARAQAYYHMTLTRCKVKVEIIKAVGNYRWVRKSLLWALVGSRSYSSVTMQKLEVSIGVSTWTGSKLAHCSLQFIIYFKPWNFIYPCWNIYRDLCWNIAEILKSFSEFWTLKSQWTKDL